MTKAYRNVMVLAGVDLAVQPGRVQALLGPNGAGKTTLVRILATLVKADSGTARVAGFDVAREGRQVRRHISLTRQYLDEADRLADRIAVLDRGRVIAEGSAAELKRQVSEQRLVLNATDTPAYEGLEYMLGPRVQHRDPLRRVLGVPTDGSADHIRTLLDECDPNRTAVASFTVHTATLDDVFHALTGDVAREPETNRG